MQSTLREALMAQATFDINNTDASNAVKLCLLPGVYNTMQLTQDPSSKDVVLNFANPAALVAAGYAADQVADDASFCSGLDVQVAGVGRVMYRDFLNTIQRVGARVNKIIIQNKVSSQDIFDQQIEIAKTVIGAKGGMDFITLQNYVSVNAYDRSKITIDLSGVDENGKSNNLFLTPEVFMAMNIPAGAHFSIQFQFNTTVSAM